MRPPIYVPEGAAGEYCELALNIYTGCNHGCTYCYARAMNKRFGKDFDENVQPRPGLMEALQLQLAKEDFRGKTVHLCFMCDPYPAPPVDTTITRQCIKVLKDNGCHVQILTKGGDRAARDFDLLDSNDWFGITFTGYEFAHDDIFSIAKTEPNAGPVFERLASLHIARKLGIKTWASLEPVMVRTDVLYFLKYIETDLVKIGKLNYGQSDFDVAAFAREAEAICIANGRDYYIKKSTRALMEASNA